MTARSSFAARITGLLLSLAAATALGGCLIYHAVEAPVKIAATTVVVTGEAAGAAVKATGKVTISAINAVGNVGGGGIDSAARLTQAGMVTFVDVATGTVIRVPWREGFTVASASTAARLELTRRAIDVVRAGSVVFSSSKLAGEGAALVSGDVVRVHG